MKFLILSYPNDHDSDNPIEWGREWNIIDAPSEKEAMAELVRRGGQFQVGEVSLISPVPVLSIHTVDGVTFRAEEPMFSGDGV